MAAREDYRSIYKWGDVTHEEKLKPHFIELIKEKFQVTDEDLNNVYLRGLDNVELTKKTGLTKKQIQELAAIVGEENVQSDDFSRANHSYGKYYGDILKLRLAKIENPPDAVVHPKNEEEIIKLVAYCNKNKIPIIPSAGRTSVTRALETPKGGIVISVLKHLNKVKRLNTENGSVTAEAGILGPALEKFLNEKGYTCGHFPQSFEFATIGGWVAAKGAGQASTGYGKMEDMLLSLRVVTPAGVIITKDYPAMSIGPSINEIFLGSEGVFGIITEVTMKVRKYNPDNSAISSFLFKDFDSALKAMRNVMQGGFGHPHFFRLQDPEETDISFKVAGIDGTLSDHFLQFIGYKPGSRSIMHVIVDGDKDYTHFILKKVKELAKREGAFETGKGPAEKWLEQRYSSAYLRDPLMDVGVMIDTLETSVSWENLKNLWSNVRAAVKARPDAICMVHISHAYENGANLYFIFISKMKRANDLDDFLSYHKTIVEAIHKNGGALSHHHGIGRMLAPYLSEELGKEAHGILKAVKSYLDPENIMNPGGTLGLD